MGLIRHSSGLAGACLHLVAVCSVAISVLFVGAKPVGAQALPLGAGDAIDAAGHMEILEDPGGALTLEDVKDRPFRHVESGAPSFGYTSSAYWVRLRVRNDSAAAEWLLVLSAPRLGDVRFYDTSVGGSEIVTGIRQVYALRPYDSRHFAFPVSLDAGEEKEVLLRVASDVAVQIPVSFWKKQAFQAREIEEALIIGLALGAHLVLLVYNSGLAVFLRSRVLMTYSALVVAAVLFYSVIYGFAYRYAWPNHPVLNLRMGMISLAALTFCGIEFIRVFVHTSRYGRLDPWLRIGSILPAVLALSMPFVPYRIVASLMTPVAFLGFVPVLLALHRARRENWPGIRYILLSTVGYAIGAAFYFAMTLGLLSGTSLARHGFLLGATVAITILSFALASQLRAFKIDAEAALAADRVKSRFLTVMSHEIRTPLTAIVGMAELLTDQVDERTRKNYTRILRESGERLACLVNQTLDFSRLEEGRLQLETSMFRVADAVEGVADLFRPVAEKKGLRFIVEDHTGGARVWGDSLRLSQVLMNLVSNAIKFTDRGSVTLEAVLGASSRGANYARIVFQVSDTGIGIPHDQREAILESFAQADGDMSRRYGGSGLGLAIANGIVALMQGQLSVSDAPGGGARFEVSLDLLQIPDAGMPAGERRQPVIPEVPRPLRVLVAEDDELNRMLLTAVLQNTGHVLHFAENGREALGLIAENEYDVGLIDLQMPEVDGYTMLRRFQAMRTPNDHIPLYALTANALPSDVEECRQAGFAGHIAKPYRGEDLRRILACVATGKPAPVDFARSA